MAKKKHFQWRKQASIQTRADEHISKEKQLFTVVAENHHTMYIFGLHLLRAPLILEYLMSALYKTGNQESGSLEVHNSIHVLAFTICLHL